MAKPNIPDPAAAAKKVKELARELDASAAAAKVRGMAKDLAADVTDTYRKSNRFLRMRVGIVGGWVLLALVAFYAACPSSGPANALSAEVMLLPETLVGQQISINNGSEEMWTEVKLTLDGKWTHQIRTIRAGQNVVVGVAKFQRDGAAAPQDLKPRQIEIDCDQGSAELSLQRR
jgi:hypothetical protein